MAEFTLRSIPEESIPERAREHMNTHVYVNITVTDRNANDRGYRAVGYRVFADREAWYGASDAEREAAISKAVKYAAKHGGNPPQLEEAK